MAVNALTNTIGIMKKMLLIDMPIIQLPNLWITVSDAYISKLEENIVGYISTIYWCDKAKEQYTDPKLNNNTNKYNRQK